MGKLINRFYSLFYLIFISPYYRVSLKEFGSKSRILSPLKIQGKKNIIIGSKVLIQYKTWLAALPLTGFIRDCRLIIGDGCVIGNFNHIFATKSIVFGKNVLTADKVYISDNLHSYIDIDVPILHQRIKQINEVKIGDGSWIGENVCIIGASIGINCVIGANSVVTKDIPDYSVAVGAPAIIVKRYNLELKTWLRTKPNGTFIL